VGISHQAKVSGNDAWGEHPGTQQVSKQRSWAGKLPQRVLWGECRERAGRGCVVEGRRDEQRAASEREVCSGRPSDEVRLS
jgi:hypothetical protein